MHTRMHSFQGKELENFGPHSTTLDWEWKAFPTFHSSVPPVYECWISQWSVNNVSEGLAYIVLITSFAQHTSFPSHAVSKLLKPITTV